MSRRDFIRLAGGLFLLAPIMSSAVPGSDAMLRYRSDVPLDATRDATDTVAKLWYTMPGREAALLHEGLPVGNGRLGALVSGDPARECLCFTDASLWQGGRNAALQADGQFADDVATFGSFTLMGKMFLAVPGHAIDAISDYRRELDLRNGCVRLTYRHGGASFRREIFASHPDGVIVIHLSQSGGGNYSGALTLEGSHGELTQGDAQACRIRFRGEFDNSLVHAACLAAHAEGGQVVLDGATLRFRDCAALTITLAAGTNYVPDVSRSYLDPQLDPLRHAQRQVNAALSVRATRLMERHVDDHRALFDTMRVDLGASTPAQRRLDTWARLQARANDHAAPDPELDATYLQYGRYLTIAGSRDGLPTNLQGLWLVDNDPPWMGDYHTNINLQMNYWLPDRAGLGSCFDTLTRYCLAQLESWTDITRRLFNDPRNGFRNSSGRIAGWTVATSVNIFGGEGWSWNPPGNAWLCNNLWQHYQYTLDRAYLAQIYPLLKGACEFWEARLVAMRVADPVSGALRELLVDDSDWSPEQGPEGMRGITYAQELIWDLFGNYVEACRELDCDNAYAATITGLQARLYLPQVSPTRGVLEEWMSPDDLGEPQHRHLSPLIGLFPGDRITADGSPKSLLDGATHLLASRGDHSFGWANAWRALCWARLGQGEKAYQLLLGNWSPSSGAQNGTALNLFDIYNYRPGNALAASGVFQIDANFGTATAMLEMLLYSRPGHIELLPALPRAWAAHGSVSGIGARGGFVVDLAWREGRPTEVTLHSVGGRATRIVHAGRATMVSVPVGDSVRLRMNAAGALERA